VATPTNKELAAVHKVLFEPKRARRMADDAASFSVLLNLQGQAQGRPVIWWVPGTGRLSPGVLEAAARCDRIASAYQQMSAELAGASVNAADKARLRSALDAMAAMWLARSTVIGDPKPPADPVALARSLSDHLLQAYEAGRAVVEYFRTGAG
jgi:hypothetical protein